MPATPSPVTLCINLQEIWCRTMPTATRIGMTHAAIEAMIERRVVEALEAYEANRNCEPTMESGDVIAYPNYHRLVNDQTYTARAIIIHLLSRGLLKEVVGW
ncbi:hypothetical protein Tco_0078001 [Tanacetum coccineum]